MQATNRAYEAMTQCYLSGQMSEAQFERHCEDDEVFAAWARRRLAMRKDGKAA